ncbi:amidoligase family protein [Anaeromicropila populeti]|uniref:Putative amidoligase enzyme n=1 Tax=Anaeromicropila populeti TaxID=37658 RepID=A0A1I6LR17_9FIRM|nr:amidoligase family protein [Anaeromicropila populeti]SFS05873.1 Putative amidoligase enzyme [Anaeromicropila populeti]
MRTQTFGIEIEMTGITRKNAASLLAEFFQTESQYVGTGYQTYEVKDKKGRTWKAMYDASIAAQKKENGRTFHAGDDYKTEVVSPILTYEDMETLQELVRKLRKGGGIINSSCGIHIHIGAEKFKPQTLRNIVNIIASKEDILYKALQIDPARLQYCKKTNEKLLETINRRKPTTMKQLKEIWYAEDPYNTSRHYNETRYHGLNLHATFTKGTVEFRLFNSTLHAGEIKAYIQFCLAVTHQALTQKKATPRKTVTDNEKYAFRCWMLRLGLNGEEFKTCRLHFLKHLEGNSAWRSGH